MVLLDLSVWTPDSKCGLTGRPTMLHVPTAGTYCWYTWTFISSALALIRNARWWCICMC